VVAPLHGFNEDLVTAVIAEVIITLSFCLKRSVNYLTTVKTEHNRPFAFSLWAHQSYVGGVRCHA